MLRILQVARESRPGAAPARAARADPQPAARGRRCGTTRERRALFMDLLCGGEGEHQPRRRRALARHPERDRLSWPLSSRLGAHRRADAVRHLPRIHRGRAHDRGDPRAQYPGARRASRGRAGRFRFWSITCNRGARCMSRCCCTTSPRAEVATTPSSAPSSRSRSAPHSACRPRRPRRSPGSSCTIC